MIHRRLTCWYGLLLGAVVLLHEVGLRQIELAPLLVVLDEGLEPMAWFVVTRAAFVLLAPVLGLLTVRHAVSALLSHRVTHRRAAHHNES